MGCMDPNIRSIWKSGWPSLAALWDRHRIVMDMNMYIENECVISLSIEC